MNTKTRRKFSSDFKSKVVLEALQERMTLEELSKKYDLHPNQVSQWKKDFQGNVSKVFHVSNTSNEDRKKDKLIDELYRQIGQLKVDNEWLKKSFNDTTIHPQRND